MLFGRGSILGFGEYKLFYMGRFYLVGFRSFGGFSGNVRKSLLEVICVLGSYGKCINWGGLIC